MAAKFEPSRVLVVDDDRETLVIMKGILTDVGLSVDTADNGERAVTRVRRPDLILLDLRLPDCHGLDVIRRLKSEGYELPFLVVSGFASVHDTVEAMQLGASSVLEKPLSDHDISKHVFATLASARHSPSVPAGHMGPSGSALTTLVQNAPRGSAAERWARNVLILCAAKEDIRTLHNWSRLCAMSYTSLRENCYVVSVRPHDACEFARVLRAILRSPGRWNPEQWLDIADRRSIAVLTRRAGLENVPPSESLIDYFLEHQSLIPPSNPGLAALRQLLLQLRDADTIRRRE